MLAFFFFFNDTATTEIYTLSLHDALPIYRARPSILDTRPAAPDTLPMNVTVRGKSRHFRTVSFDAERNAVLLIEQRSEEHTSELQSRPHLVCRLLLEKKQKTRHRRHTVYS